MRGNTCKEYSFSGSEPCFRGRLSMPCDARSDIAYPTQSGHENAEEVQRTLRLKYLLRSKKYLLRKLNS
jgi:hypothetical protein